MLNAKTFDGVVEDSLFTKINFHFRDVENLYFPGLRSLDAILIFRETIFFHDTLKPRTSEESPGRSAEVKPEGPDAKPPQELRKNSRGPRFVSLAVRCFSACVALI